MGLQPVTIFWGLHQARLLTGESIQGAVFQNHQALNVDGGQKGTAGQERTNATILQHMHHGRLVLERRRLSPQP